MVFESSETTALFRAHATARLRGDTAEADRLAAHIGEEQRMSHMLFTLALFAQYVREELGYEPDRESLVALTARLHEKHYRPGGSFEAIRGEAMVRAVTVEPCPRMSTMLAAPSDFASARPSSGVRISRSVA